LWWVFFLFEIIEGFEPGRADAVKTTVR